MYLQEQLVREKVRSMLAEAQESGRARRAAAMRRARRRARRASAQLHQAQRTVMQLRSSLHAQS